MNITLTELQVIENKAITKRLAGILGEEVDAIETYTLKAEPDSLGVYQPITMTPISFKYYNGVVIKGDGVSEYVFNDNNMVVGKTLLVNGPTPKNIAGSIIITPMYNIYDYAKVSAAMQDSLDPEKWILTLEDKNYLYSSIVGTPITGKLAVIGRSFLLTADGRIAQITIDTVLKEGDDLETMTSDEYNERVAEEIQTKIEYFFGTEFATCTYNTTTKCYQIIMQEAGEIHTNITANTLEDLSYFGFRSPTYSLGSEDVDFPKVMFLTGDLVDMDGYSADITGPDTVEVTLPGITPEESDFVDQEILIGNAGVINYEVIVF